MAQQARATVLIIDDTADHRELYTIAAESAGFRTLSAATAMEGLRLARFEQPDAIVLDIHMPEVSGFGALAALAGDPKAAHIPRFVVTADTTAETRARATQLGVAGFFVKPFDPANLTDAIRDRLSGSATPKAGGR